MPARDIEEVLVHLDQILDDTSVPVTLKLFPALYRQVTAAVRDGIAAGRFEDGPRMDRFDTHFANRYLRAFARHREGLRPSGAWRVAFRFGESGRGIAMQHLLLGMNAHINLDLAVAAARVAPGAEVTSLEVDFARINDLLASMVDGAQQAIGEFSPMLDVLDRVGGRVDEAVVEFSIRRARHAAWEATELLAPMERDSQRRSVRLLDRSVKMLGRSIARPGPVVAAAVGVVEITESRDVAAIVDRLRRLEAGA